MAKDLTTYTKKLMELYSNKKIETGKSQERQCEEMGIDSREFSAIINRHKNPTKGRIRMFCEYYGCEHTELYEINKKFMEE